MKKLIMMGMASTVLLCSPVLAHPGGGGGAGGGMGASGSMGGGMGASGGMGGYGGMGGMDNSMGRGPPITPPGQTSDPRAAAQGIAAQQGQFGRDFAALQKKSPDELKAMAADHRKSAQAMAAAARAGANIPESAKDRIRSALDQDIMEWRAEFQVGRKAWQDMRNQWLSERSTMSARDWAARRADWFAARDAWIAKQKTYAMARTNR